MVRRRSSSSCRERLYVLVQGLSDFNSVVPMISQERTEPAVFGCDEPGKETLGAAWSKELPGPKLKTKIWVVRSHTLLRLVTASLPLPLLALSVATRLYAVGLRDTFWPIGSYVRRSDAPPPGQRGSRH